MHHIYYCSSLRLLFHNPEGNYHSLIHISASLVSQRVRHQPVMWETRVRSLGGEDDLKKEIATHSSIVALENPMGREAWWATVHGVAKSQTGLRNFTLFMFYFLI